MIIILNLTDFKTIFDRIMSRIFLDIKIVGIIFPNMLIISIIIYPNMLIIDKKFADKTVNKVIFLNQYLLIKIIIIRDWSHFNFWVKV